MALVEIKCAQCGFLVKRRVSEVNRAKRLNRRLFCSKRCSSEVGSAIRRAKTYSTRCPYCNLKFVTSTHNKAKRFCSRSCASRGSMSESRRRAQRRGGLAQRNNLLTTAECLRKRESWKYVELKAYLGHRNYQFEYPLKNYVFDLALLDINLLIEFDGEYHRRKKQKSRDLKKELIANAAGFRVVRIPVEPATVIPFFTITEY